MNNISKKLLINITDKGRDWGFVCIEHKRFVPCRTCLYDTVATIPYSETDEDRKIVTEYQRS